MGRYLAVTWFAHSACQFRVFGGFGAQNRGEGLGGLSCGHGDVGFGDLGVEGASSTACRLSGARKANCRDFYNSQHRSRKQDTKGNMNIIWVLPPTK